MNLDSHYETENNKTCPGMSVFVYAMHWDIPYEKKQLYMTCPSVYTKIECVVKKVLVTDIYLIECFTTYL